MKLLTKRPIYILHLYIRHVLSFYKLMELYNFVVMTAWILK